MDNLCKGNLRVPPEGAHTGAPLRFVCIFLTATRCNSGFQSPAWEPEKKSGEGRGGLSLDPTPGLLGLLAEGYGP